MNFVILKGRLGRDPEMRTTNSGKVVVNFTLATDIKINGEKQTTWHNITVWGKMGEIMYKYLKKGREILLDGRIQNRSYEDAEGNKKYISEVIVNNFEFCSDGSNKSTGEAAGPSAPEDEPPYAPETPESNITDDDLPF